MKGSDYHNASSFDTLHTNHGGIWNDHMKVELQRHVQSLGRQAAMTIDARLAMISNRNLQNLTIQLLPGQLHFHDGGI